MRVLLAEDDKRLGNLIKYMLEQNKITVEWVVSGDMAYEYAIYDEYDILILDWMMPIESGISACRRLRAAGYEKAIKESGGLDIDLKAIFESMIRQSTVYKEELALEIEKNGGARNVSDRTLRQ